MVTIAFRSSVFKMSERQEVGGRRVRLTMEYYIRVQIAEFPQKSEKGLPRGCISAGLQ